MTQEHEIGSKIAHIVLINIIYLLKVCCHTFHSKVYMCLVNTYIDISFVLLKGLTHLYAKWATINHLDNIALDLNNEIYQQQVEKFVE